MSNQIKVMQTRMYKKQHSIEFGGRMFVNENEVPVVEGKLVLVGKREFVNLSTDIDWETIKPIIISETEKIEDGDYAYHKSLNRYGKVTNITTATQGIRDIKIEGELYHDLSSENNFAKILVLPEQFSPKHLQDIVDGKIKDGDRVMIEIEEGKDFTIKNCKHGNECDCIGMCNLPFDQVIKLNSEGHVILHKDVEKTYTKEEVKEIATSWARYCRDTDFLEALLFDKWFDKYIKQ